MKLMRSDILLCLTLALCLVQTGLAGQWHELSHLAEQLAPVDSEPDAEADQGLCERCLAGKSTQLAYTPFVTFPMVASLFTAPLSLPASSPEITASAHRARGPPVDSSKVVTRLS